MMYASSFPMNRSFPAWMQRDADTGGSSHVCNLPRTLARMLILVIFGKAVKCLSWINRPSPSGDPVPPRPAPLSFVIRCLQYHELFLPFLLQALSHATSLGHLLRLCGWTACMAVHSDMSSCFPQSWQCRVSLLPLPLPLAFASSACFGLVTVQIRFGALGALLASFLASVISSATRPFIPFFFHDATLPLRWVLSCLFPCQRCTLSKRSHTRSLLVSESLCVIFAWCVRTFPRSIGTGPSSAIISLMMISSFSMISSNFLGPVRNSRLMSFGIISLTTNIFCPLSIALTDAQTRPLSMAML